MLKLIQRKLGARSTPKTSKPVLKRQEYLPASGPKDEIVTSSQSEAKASEWDTMSGVEKTVASTLGGWLGLSTVGILLGMATPIGPLVALGIGTAAGVGATQAKGRLLKSDLSKSEATQQNEARAAEPSSWKQMSGLQKIQSVAGLGGGGALVLGSLAIAATSLAAPVALAAGAAITVAGGVGLLNAAKDSDFQGWGSSSSSRDDDDTGLRMTTDGEVHFGLGGGMYMGLEGGFGVDYGGGNLTGLDGKSHGRFLA